jgi:hypothetical protein
VGLPTARVAVNDVLLIRAIGPGANLAAIKAAADRMDTLIHGLSGSAIGTTIFMITRESDFALEEVVNGKLVSHLGGLYRAWAQ